MSWIYVNGQIVPEEKGLVSVYDHGYLYGDGVFDTMRSYGGQIFAFNRHWERLTSNARQMRLPLQQSKTEVLEGIEQVLKANNLSDAYLRLTLTRGMGPIGIDYRLCDQATLVIMVKELATNPKVWQEGIKAITLATRRVSPESQDPAIKSCNFLNNIFAKMELIDQGTSEGIMLNSMGWVTEATVSNIFLWDGKRLCTPAKLVGLLPGVTREVVLALAAEQGLITQEGFYTVNDLYKAKEVFLTNSISELIPVTCVDGKIIGEGIPGLLTKSLHQAYRDAVNKRL